MKKAHINIRNEAKTESRSCTVEGVTPKQAIDLIRQMFEEQGLTVRQNRRPRKEGSQK